MLKKILFVFAISIFISSQALAQKMDNLEMPDVLDITVQERLDQATQLEAEGKYLEAKEIYEALLPNKDISKEEQQEVKEAYENLNMKLLHSRYEMPGSQYHEVVAGDNLHNIAKKYNTTVALLKKSNGLKNDTIHPGMKLKVVTSTVTIRVNKTQNTLTLFLDDKPIKEYKVSTGANDTTPAGEYKIANKLENPTWYKAGAVVPPDSPDNILGARWLGFDYQGYGIHGTTEPELIGQSVSSGCVRMRNEDVEEIYPIIPLGTKVVITD